GDPHRILSPARLPVSPLRRQESFSIPKADVPLLNHERLNGSGFRGARIPVAPNPHAKAIGGAGNGGRPVVGVASNPAGEIDPRGAVEQEPLISRRRGSRCGGGPADGRATHPR